jgi:hypothetical protein
MVLAAALIAAASVAVPAPTATAGKVQVYILMGQSNMLGEGKIGGTATEGNTTLHYSVEHGMYPYLWDEASKNWTSSKTVRNVFNMGSGDPTSKAQLLTNNWMNGGDGHKGSIGPELGIGFALEAHSPTIPTMALKSCTGNRALGWDLLPPGTKSWDWTDPTNASLVYNYAGYHESPARCLKSERGNNATCAPIAWIAGCQYDGDFVRAQTVLKDIGTYYPGATEFEVAGFFWWQGDRDSRDLGLTEQYEFNLVALIKQLRTQYNAPNAPFVTASLGQSTLPTPAVPCGGNCGGGILQAMLNVANSEKYPEFKGNVAAVDSHKFSEGSSSGSHYGGDARTYMNIGQAMGAAMVEMLK